MAADTAADPAEFTPETTVEDAGPCLKKVAVKVPATAVAARIDQQYDELSRTVALKGFRKGRAPRSLLESRFGEDILEDVKHAVAADAWDKAVEAEGLRPIGDPDADLDDVEIAPDKDLEFEVTVEVWPEFDLPEYTGLKAERPAVAPADDEIEQELENLAKRKAEVVPVWEGTVEPGDFLTTTLEVEHKPAEGDPAETLTLEDYEVYVGGSHLLGADVGALAEAFADKTAGDTVEFEVDALPGGFRESAMAGDPAVIRVTVGDIRRQELPEMNDEWAKTMDFDDLAELRDEISKELARAKEREADRAVEDQLLGQIVEKADIELPEGIVESQMERLIETRRLELQYQGVPAGEIEEALSGLRKEGREEIEQGFREQFVLEKIAEQEKIFVTESDVDEAIQQLAARHRAWPHEVRAQMEQEGRMSHLRRNLREDKVRALLRDKAEITGADGAEGADDASDDKSETGDDDE